MSRDTVDADGGRAEATLQMAYRVMSNTELRSVVNLDIRRPLTIGQWVQSYECQCRRHSNQRVCRSK